MRNLSVRLTGAFGERNITSELMDLSFRSEGSGGFKSASFELARPMHRDAPELAALNQVYVYDVRSPRQIAWQGYLEDPGRAADSRGLVWTVNAVGPAARLKDRRSPMVYMDRRVDSWRRGESSGTLGPLSHPNLNTDQDQPKGFFSPGWMLRLEQGSLVSLGDQGSITYELIIDSGQHLARIVFDWEGGAGDSNNRLFFGAATASTYAAVDNFGFTGGAPTNASWVITTDFPTDRIQLWLAVVRQNTTTTPTTDLTNIFLYHLAVQGTRYNKSGTEQTSASVYANNYLFSYEVVADIVGRWLSTICDGPNANIDQTATYHIDNLAYTDPVDGQQILDDLEVFEPDFRWAIWGDTQADKAMFEYVRWDSGDVLEATPIDGFSSPESSSDLYSEVLVRYNDGTSKIRTVKRTQTVPALQGITRTGFLDIADEKGVTDTNVARAGDSFLLSHNTPSHSGTLIVARPIQNTTRGIMVDPHMIRPGTIIRLKGVQARPDYLNAIDHNGVTMFRVAATEYSASTGTCTLELENYNPTVARQLADAQQKIEQLRGKL